MVQPIPAQRGPRDAKFTDIPGPRGAKSSVAYGINDSGLIVGVYSDSTGKDHGFLLRGKTYTTLDPPGHTRISPRGGEKSFFLTSSLQELGQQLLSNQQPGLAKFLAPVTPPLAQSTAFIG
jgi:uncharacterized membrane protein